MEDVHERLQAWKLQQLHSSISIRRNRLQHVLCSTKSFFAFLSVTQKDGFCVDDSPRHSVECASAESFALFNDFDKEFTELSAFFLLYLHKLLSDALLNKLSNNMLPQWSKVKTFSAELGLPPLVCPFLNAFNASS